MKVHSIKLSRMVRLNSNFGMITEWISEDLSDVINGNARIEFTDDRDVLLENSEDILSAIIAYHKSKMVLEKYFPKKIY